VVGRDGGQYAGGTKPLAIGEFLIEILLDQVRSNGSMPATQTPFGPCPMIGQNCARLELCDVQEYCATMFPRIPVPIFRDIQAKARHWL
jgi:hypothetical protein